MLPPIRRKRHLTPGEQSPVAINKAFRDVLILAVESRKYLKHTNFRPRYGPTKYSRLPAMLKTLSKKYGLGGIMCEVFKRYGHPLKWTKGYNGFIALTIIRDAWNEDQFHIPQLLAEWGFNVKSYDEYERLKDFIYRLDCKIA